MVKEAVSNPKDNEYSLQWKYACCAENFRVVVFWVVTHAEQAFCVIHWILQNSG